MVLEVDRVEDARTIRQRLRIPAAQWRTFAAKESAGAVPDREANAYVAWQGFWDWLAAGHADALPAAPLDDPHTQRWRRALPGCPRNIATGKAGAESGA